MWNIDIETRIRDLDAAADERPARLLDTMTETDGSAKQGWMALRRGVERLEKALGRPRARSRGIPPCPTSIAQGR